MQATAGATASKLAAFARLLSESASNDSLGGVEDAGLSPTQLKAMHAIGGAGHDLSLKAVAERLGGLSVPTVSRAVDGLVQRGFATRTEDPGDRRVKRLRLTARGRRTIERLVELRAAELEAVLATLEDGERERLASALDPILRRHAR